jgi:hypothetical protein
MASPVEMGLSTAAQPGTFSFQLAAIRLLLSMHEPVVQIFHRPFQPASGGSRITHPKCLERRLDPVRQIRIAIFLYESG